MIDKIDSIRSYSIRQVDSDCEEDTKISEMYRGYMLVEMSY